MTTTRTMGLTADDLEKIKFAQARISEIEDEITRAEIAGIDVSAQKTALADRKAKLSKLRSAFFPNE